MGTKDLRWTTIGYINRSAQSFRFHVSLDFFLFFFLLFFILFPLQVRGIIFQLIQGIGVGYHSYGLHFNDLLYIYNAVKRNKNKNILLHILKQIKYKHIIKLHKTDRHIYNNIEFFF